LDHQGNPPRSDRARARTLTVQSLSRSRLRPNKLSRVACAQGGYYAFVEAVT
jgi:hypothetical protein